MLVLGILFLLFGAISTWVVDSSVVLNDQTIDMDLVGLIFLILGSIATVFGLYQTETRKDA